MRDLKTKAFPFVIQDPPPREPAAAAPGDSSGQHEVSGSGEHGLTGSGEYELRGPEATRPNRNKPTPQHLARRPGSGRRPIPPMRTERVSALRDGPLMTAGLLLGVGLGGSVEGLLFHQILQPHDVLAGHLTSADLQAITVWSHALHAFTWLALVIGIALLWRTTRHPGATPRTSTFVGSLLLGLGCFNSVEGVLDHHVRSVHHAYSGYAEVLWSGGFIASGFVFILIGGLFILAGRR